MESAEIGALLELIYLLRFKCMDQPTL